MAEPKDIPATTAPYTKRAWKQDAALIFLLHNEIQKGNHPHLSNLISDADFQVAQAVLWAIEPDEQEQCLKSAAQAIVAGDFSSTEALFTQFLTRFKSGPQENEIVAPSETPRPRVRDTSIDDKSERSRPSRRADIDKRYDDFYEDNRDGRRRNENDSRKAGRSVGMRDRNSYRARESHRPLERHRTDSYRPSQSYRPSRSRSRRRRRHSSTSRDRYRSRSPHAYRREASRSARHRSRSSERRDRRRRESRS
ncbi:hypothetical protein N431DRAFT_46070 [Stipitochalara longipes BDJ]|nr:hypothetical protein N431DRAFT_46070 [Stipitochalara longipes BDJ]